MLVLSRKTGQQIVIGGNVVVTITGIDGGRVKVGIDAPPEIHIARGELESRGDGPNRPRAAA